MISQAALEEAVITLLCFDAEQAANVAIKIPDPNIFSNRTHQKLAQTAIEYIQKFGQAPGGALEYLLENDFKRGEEGKLLAQTYDLMRQQAASIQSSFVIEELDTFLEHRRLSTALVEAMENLNQGELSAARDVLYKNVAPAHTTDKGLWLKSPRDALSFLDRLEENEFFSTGIQSLDDRKILPERKMLMVFLASAGKGKSWFLINAGKAALQHHHSVLHITLEMSGEKVMRRYIQNIFSLTKDELKTVRAPIFTRDAQSRLLIDFQSITRDSVVAKRKELQQRIAGMLSYPDLVVQEFPTSVLTTERLSLYLDSLVRDRGFRPDMIIVDYADLMKIDAAQLRIDTGRLYRELRGIAVVRNAALLTASQGNRESEEAKLVTNTNVAEDWSKIGTADGVITYSQTPDEFKLGLARLFVSKYRDESDKFLTLISQAYSIGQFCLDSVPMNVDAVNEIGRLSA